MRRDPSSSLRLHEKKLTYDTRGLLQSEQVFIQGQPGADYSTSYAYDSYLRPQRTTYPDTGFVETSATAYPNS